MQVAYYRSTIVCALWILATLLLSGTASAQTGKISGKVVDAQSRQALPGVNVIIDGTTLGAATDADGDYFIINVPPGSYTLSATMIGYARQAQTDVIVQIERTVVVDFALGTQAVQGEEVTISAEREIIQMDLSTSATHMAAAEFTTTPITQVADYLIIQEGIDYESNAEGKWMSIRGGGRDETEFFVDGQSTMNQMRSQAYMSVSKTAIKEVSIQTGGFTAEYGRARSGLVNVVTLDGSRQEYSVALDGKYSFPHLKHFGRNLYDRNAPYMAARGGTANFIPEEMINGTGTYTATDAQAYGLKGEVIIDPMSPEYRGWKYNQQEDGSVLYTEQFDVNGNGTLDPYTAEEVTRYGMDPIGTFPQQLQWSGWKIVSNALAGNTTIQDNLNPSDLVAEWMIQHPGLDYGSDPDYDMDVTLSGPLPGERMNNKLGDLLAKSTFMVSYRTQTSRFVYPQSRRAFRDMNLQGKITTTITPQTKLRLSALYGEAYSINRYRGDDRDPLGNYEGAGFYVTTPERGPADIITGVRGGGRLGGDLGQSWENLFNEGGLLHNDAYMFTLGARLTHTVSPSTYFELEYQYQRNVDNQHPMWPAARSTDPGGGWPQASWIYNRTDAAGNLLLNDRGEPRTFITNDPNDLFLNGVSLIFDPALKDLVDDDVNGLSAVPAANVNKRNRPVSFGGTGTWPFSMELASSWFDDEQNTGSSLKGPNRLHMVQGVDALGQPVAWIDDIEAMPGSWDWRDVMNGVREPDLYSPGNGGLMYGAEQPGKVLVGGYRPMGGWRQSVNVNTEDRLGEFTLNVDGRSIDRGLITSHGGRLVVVSQLTKHNQIKAGADLRFYNAQSMSTVIHAGAFYVNEDPANGGRNDIWGNYVFGWGQYRDNPFELGAFIQDKIEVQGLIANIGMRMDIFDPTTDSFDFRDPYRDEFRRSTIYADPTIVTNHFDALRTVKASPKIKWSPRIGLSFPVTEASKVYFNYGWFYQRPTIPAYFQYWTPRNEPQRSLIPNVNQEWPRTVQMEMGYEQDVKGWFLLHAAGYYKDEQDLSRVYEWQGLGFANGMRSTIASGYADIRGLEFRIDKNYGLFRARTNFNYMLRTRGKTTGQIAYEDPDENFAEQENVIRALQETKPEPQPNFRGTLGFFSPRRWGPKIGENVHPLDNVTVNLIYTWRDGGERRMYTGATAADDFYIGIIDRTNTDLRAEKRIPIGRRVNLGLYVQVFNLFDQKYLADNVSGNSAIEAQDRDAYHGAIRFDHPTSPAPGNDQYGEFKKQWLSDTLPWWKDNILFDDKRDVFYGLSLTFN